VVVGGYRGSFDKRTLSIQAVPAILSSNLNTTGARTASIISNLVWLGTWMDGLFHFLPAVGSSEWFRFAESPARRRAEP
jgi:hypothetical protein